MVERLTFTPPNESHLAPMPQLGHSNEASTPPPREEESQREVIPSTTSSAEATVFEHPLPLATPSSKELDRISRKRLLLRPLTRLFRRK